MGRGVGMGLSLAASGSLACGIMLVASESELGCWC